MSEFLPEFIRYFFWKVKAKRAIKDKRVTTCTYCREYIFPGDLVIDGTNRNGDPILVHAGFHHSLKSRAVFCETGTVANGVWEGYGVRPFSFR